LDTFNTVGNVINISRDAYVLTPKGIVKRTAKETGKAVISERNHTSISNK